MTNLTSSAASISTKLRVSHRRETAASGKRMDVRRIAAVSEGGYWWNPTTQELIEILPEDHPDHRQNQALIDAAIRRWSGGISR